ncbi:MAG TPA: hypothetical protein VLM37_07645 [Fibrobacteraceae bacterium]|nr:hypothetical protein [Fibrobacteraceae bacterium]
MKFLIPGLFTMAIGIAFAQNDLTATQTPDSTETSNEASIQEPQPAAEPTQPAEPTPAQEADDEMAGLGAWLNNSEAQDKAFELMQEGKYVRRSLSIVPMMFWMGQGPDQIRRRHKPVLVAALRDSLMHMARFDINPVSLRGYGNLRNAWNRETAGRSSETKRRQALDRLVSEKLSPDLFGTLAQAMQERAQRNLTEDQMNSFMVDKAKESGITAAELNLALNSGYVVIPVATYLAYGINDKGGFEATIRGGLILYKVHVDKDRIWMEKRAELIRVGQEIVDKDGYSLMARAMLPSDERTLPTQEIIMYEAISKMLSSVMQDMRDMPEFRLLSQISWAEKSQFQAPFSPMEIKDVPMDKFFEQVEQVMDKEGSVKEEITGWGFVNKPYQFKYPVRKIDPNIPEYTWQGYMASGTPQAYANVREYSRVPVDVDFRGGVASMGVKGYITPDDSVDISTLCAFFQLQTMYGPIGGLSQSNIHVNATLRFASVDDTLESTPYALDAMYAYDVGLGFGKKFWLGRFVPSISLDALFGQVAITATDTYFNYYEMTIKDYYVGGRATLGLEYAISPNVRVGISGSGTFNANLGSWETSYGDDTTSYAQDFADGQDEATLQALNFEAGAYLMVNTWPLTKLVDKIKGSTAQGVGGVIHRANLRPLP